MSQEKVARHKAEKANRKVRLKNEKRRKILTNIGVGVVALAIVSWVGYSVYATATRPPESVEVDVTAIDDYLGSLSSAE